MAAFILQYRSQAIHIDSESLDPGELSALKHLGNCPHFTFERLRANDRIPLMDHDALDDIALELVKSNAGGENGHQAKQRVAERGLR